jgi:hypothetical protein
MRWEMGGDGLVMDDGWFALTDAMLRFHVLMKSVSVERFRPWIQSHVQPVSLRLKLPHADMTLIIHLSHIACLRTILFAAKWLENGTRHIHPTSL